MSNIALIEKAEMIFESVSRVRDRASGELSDGISRHCLN